MGTIGVPIVPLISAIGITCADMGEPIADMGVLVKSAILGLTPIDSCTSKSPTTDPYVPIFRLTVGKSPLSAMELKSYPGSLAAIEAVCLVIQASI